MDFGRAFNYPRNDPGWITKMLILAVVSIVPIVNFAAGGYLLEAIRRVASGDDSALPEWDNFGGYFMDGLRLVVTYFVYILPIFVLVIPVIVMAAASGRDDGGGAGLLILLAQLFQFFWQFIIWVVTPALMAQLALSAGFGAGFNFGGIVGTITRNMGNYVMVLLGTIGFGFFGALGLIACFVGILITGPWSQLAVAHMIGQLVRQNVDPGTVA